MAQEKWFGEERKASLVQWQQEAEPKGVPLSVQLTVGGPETKYHISVYEPKASYYSRMGRVVVAYNSKQNSWHCPCAKLRQSCTHKAIGKWHLFATRRQLFKKVKSTDIEESIPPERTIIHLIDSDVIGLMDDATLQKYIPSYGDRIAIFNHCRKILNKSLNVSRILPDNKEEAGRGSGVLRDVLSCFWQEFYERCTLGTTVKVPFIRHDFPAETWKAIGRILLKGYQDCEYFPNKRALPFLEQVLFDNVYSVLKAYCMQLVSSQEREVLMQALTDFTAVDTDDLLEVLDSYGCRRKVSAENLPKIIEEIAHKEMVQKPMFAIDCWREMNDQHLNLSPEALTKLLSDLQPTTKRVCKLLKCDVDLTTNQKEVANHLKRFIRELDESKLQKFLRFCTGSDLIVTDSIYVGFENRTEFTRRPIAHTCGNILHLADSYENFPDLRSEFNAVLESNVWVMDIV
ncbi:hypothetical protein KUCAC02_023528 [Chaenocephalus aceratus]|uniref:Uncharacterized protein n=1 Tax=Chaenocephalus aceratus TaxID=36190 RepID=A0ACB9XQ75_CHAAC|nr:hypothetical protein KUCAC02_023528 [Chaenocephalus aceratus]